MGVKENMGKKGRVLLITPNLKGFKHGINRIQPPLGPMIAANIIRNKYDHEVFIHDCALENWGRKIYADSNVEGTVIYGQSNEEIAETIERIDPDVVGISSLFTNLVSSAHNVARISKKVRPKVPVILGGNQFTNAVSDYLYAIDLENGRTNIPQKIIDLEDQNIDYMMWGEVDNEHAQLADALIQGRDVSKIPGLVMRKGNESGNGLEYIINERPQIPKKLSDHVPRPARDLVNMEGYFERGMFHSPRSKSSRVLSVMCSRGCPELCTFCTTPGIWGATVRWRDTEDIMAEIWEGVNNYKIGEIQFEDDTLTANNKKLMELCKELEKVGLPWCTPNGTKLDYHQKKENGKYVTGGNQLEMYKAMAASGCYQISLACESGVQRVIDEIFHKKLDVDAMKVAVENARRAGISPHTFWIVGSPGETYEEIEQTVKYAEEVGSDSCTISICNPFPGTPIYRQVMRENLWWPGRDLKDCILRNSLIRVDGFSSPEEFEKYVGDNLERLKNKLGERNSELFQRHYGENVRERVKDVYLHQS